MDTTGRDAMKTTWRKMISEHMKEHGEDWPNVEAKTLTDEQLDVKFCPWYGHEQGLPFTLWTAKRVYFPASYDGAEWVDSVSRNPDGVPTKHVG